MGAFKTMFSQALKVCEVFVLNQWFGACNRLTKSNDLSKQGFVTSNLCEPMNHANVLRSPLVVNQ